VSLWGQIAALSQKEEFVSASVGFEQAFVVMCAKTEIFTHHGMNILFSATAEKASSKSLQISEIASGCLARNDVS
jgi:hypothetical protein